MSEEKQIEELSEILRKVCDATPNGKCMSKLCCVCRAETVIRAGYRKQSEGEWNQQMRPYDDFIECSSCGKWFNIIDNCTEKFQFCPNCGARMKGGAE